MFATICRAMSSADFYPHDASGLERRETHISVIFLAGPWVYKLKKPVNFDFLDFRSLDDRRLFCEREVLLNRRLSKGIYQKVVGIHRNDRGKLTLAPEGPVVEFAVQMTRLPQDRSLDVLIENQAVVVDQVRALGDMLAAFYNTAERSPGIDAYGTHDLIAYNMEENFAGIEPFVGEGPLKAERWDFIRQVCRCFLKDHGDLFAGRIAAGRIRDGHGDLRCEHVYYHHGIQVIDCIEFNDRFRYGDAALDLAFLIMDLDHLGRPDLGRKLLVAYAVGTGDVQIYQLLDFYAAYRALVRLKVACLCPSPQEPGKKARHEDGIRRYLHQAYMYALLFGRPTLWVFFGLPASGKSTLAARTAAALSLPLLQSDVERKSGGWEFPDGEAGFDQGPYSPVQRGRVYARLVSLAQDGLKAGRSVILDATFVYPKWRQWVFQLARDMDADQVWVECVCDRQTSLSRLAQREHDPGLSDARLAHFLEMERRVSPLIAEKPDTHLVVDTDQPVNRALMAVLSGASRAKRAQIGPFLL